MLTPMLHLSLVSMEFTISLELLTWVSLTLFQLLHFPWPPQPMRKELSLLLPLLNSNYLFTMLVMPVMLDLDMLDPTHGLELVMDTGMDLMDSTLHMDMADSVDWLMVMLDTH